MSDDAFELFWHNIELTRIEVNNLIENDDECTSYGITDEIESPSVGRGAARVAIPNIAENADVDEIEAAKLYWKEYYISAFEGVIIDLNTRLESDMMKTLYEMEMILVDLVGTPGMDFSIENIERNYGTGSNKEGAPFGQELTKNAI